MNAYEERKQARIDRYNELAEKNRTRAEGRYKNARRQIEGIPFGQPILVGHHSERRHRADLGRHDTNMRAAIDLDKRAAHYAGKAHAAESNTAISADDPEAVAKLKEKLAKREAQQQHMKDFNRAHRAWKKKPDAPATLKLLAAFTEEQQAQLKAYVPAYSWEPAPFAPYQMQNNNANIKRIRDRIAEIEREQELPEAEAIEGDGWKLVEDAEENRIKFEFEGKPPAETRTLLKSRGFRWRMSNTRTIWLRQTVRAGEDPTEGDYRYVVERVQNTVKWKIGDVLSKAAVDDLCQYEDPTVNIK
jgi:hypothetical protein